MYAFTHDEVQNGLLSQNLLFGLYIKQGVFLDQSGQNSISAKSEIPFHHVPLFLMYFYSVMRFQCSIV